MTIGGQTALATEHLDALPGERDREEPGNQIRRRLEVPSPAPEPAQGPDLSRTIPAAWQMRFSESVVAGMTRPSDAAHAGVSNSEGGAHAAGQRRARKRPPVAVVLAVEPR